MKLHLPKLKGARELMFPRWAVPLVWAAIVLAIHILLPWAIANLGPRFGWAEAAPGKWNLTGLIAVVIGLALYIWCLAVHFRSYHAPVKMGFDPPALVVAGPYKFSRNPMYLSALIAWIGWMIFYGSPSVFVAMVILWSVFALRVIPLEEHQLEALFGDEYLDYKRTVARWFGRA